MERSALTYKTFLFVISSFVFASGFFYLTRDAKAIIPRGCNVCDAYGNCVRNSSTSCDPGSDECGIDADCTGGVPTPPPGYVYPPCSECDPSIGICEQLPPPCSGYTCNPNTRCPMTPISSTDCPLNNGFPWCTQTNPDYGQWILDGCGERVYQYTCGQAVVSSVLCKYKGKCNVMDNINNEMSNIRCDRTGNSDLYTILDRTAYEGDYELYPATPDVVLPNEAYFSRDKLIALVREGNVLVVSGTFRAEGGSSIGHHSLIVGVTDSGELIYNDPYFNCDNPNETNRVCTDTIEEEMDFIHITQAFIVAPED